MRWKLRCAAGNWQIGTGSPLGPRPIIEGNIALAGGCERKQKNRRRHARAAGRNDRACEIESSSCKEHFDFFHWFDFSICDHLAPRQIETAGNMTRPQSWARLWSRTAEPRSCSRIDDLRRSGFARHAHMAGIGDGGGIEIDREVPGLALHRSALDRTALGQPPRQASREPKIRKVHQTRAPPCKSAES